MDVFDCHGIEINFKNMKSIKYSQLNDIEQKALAEAERVLENAYEPIFNFRVGACLISANDELISGTNFANTAYGSSLCAERAAVLRAHSMGIKKFKSIVIIARNGDKPTDEVTAPCGDCRQVLNEVSDLSGNNLKVILSTTLKNKIVSTSIKELLPLAFGPKNLIIDTHKRKHSK
jgi:cytidine deaminase